MTSRIRIVGTLLLLSIACILVASLGCGTADPASSLAPNQAEAVKALEAVSAKTSIREGKVTYVDFNAVKDASAALVHLKELPDVEKLNFSSSNLNDDALANLSGLNNLKELGLWGSSRITDDGLAHLAGLPKLERLNLTECNVTDSGLAHLKDLKTVTHLHLNSTKITDAGLEHLAGLEQLVWVDAYATGVTEAGAQKFREQHPETELEFAGAAESAGPAETESM
jgi:hypothetical protein